MELTTKEKIKTIKANLHLKGYKLALKLGINTYELDKFCIKNKIKLAPEKHILKFLKLNPSLSIGIIKRMTGFNKEEISRLMGNNSTFRMNVYKTNKNIEKEKTIDNNIEIPYNKVSNTELNEIISKIDTTATKFIEDLKLLNIGDALQIKKEDWKLKKIHFYFKNITRNTDVKVRIKDIGEFYYVIRKA
jgi:hypothetical protein